jgi:hypothetical protein
MSTALEEVKIIIEASALSEEDKKLIIGHLSVTEPVIAELVLKALAQNPKLISKLLSSFKEKNEAQGDSKKLESIALREKKEVLEVLKEK